MLQYLFFVVVVFNSNAHFGNALIFKDMDDTDIKNVETWIKTKTLLKLTEELNNTIAC